MQTKFLKKLLGVAYSTCNAFLFLELGVLPIEYEIIKRRLMFLHRILQLEDNDPVRTVLGFQVEQANAGSTERNWWTGVKESLASNLGTSLSLEEIKNMSKDKYKKVVKEAIEKEAFEKLKKECASKKKTEHLQYSEFKTQEYLKFSFPNVARLMFKCRSRTLDIKTHSTYKYRDVDTVCRRCGEGDEELLHVVNCGHEDHLSINFSTDVYDEVHIIRSMKRVEQFLNVVEEKMDPE